MAETIMKYLKKKARSLENDTEKCCKINENINICKICYLEDLISKDWRDEFETEYEKEYFLQIKKKLHEKIIFPKLENIFSFTYFFPIEDTKVVILGQDPYHNENQAIGLSFSVPKDVGIPPSLRNIYKELKNDIPDFSIPTHGNLEKWAKQGVLLLNDVLTVEKHKPGSHSNFGWKFFTKSIFERINEKCNNVVFILWGNYAKSKSKNVDHYRHLVLEAAHPSPFSVMNFFGCKHFSKTNEYLKKCGKSPIDWNL